MICLLMGYPASGKSTIAAEFKKKGFRVLSRDAHGGAVIDLIPEFKRLMTDSKDVLLDNTFPTALSRNPFVELAKRENVPVKCIWLQTSIEDAQLNACIRMIRKFGHLPTPEEIKASKDPNVFPPASLFRYRKIFEKPSSSEGFNVEVVKFERKKDPTYTNKAIIFDYDGTLRKSKGSKSWPLKPTDVVILPDRRLSSLKAGDATLWSARLLGASNQSAVAKGELSEEDARLCFDKTNKLLGVDIDYEFCPHKVPPISCWCRKPMPGLGVHFIEKYQLDASKCIMVGDKKSDETFANRCGFQFAQADQFFL